jgi:GNAT superfamily N-acetyltransferase
MTVYVLTSGDEEVLRSVAPGVFDDPIDECRSKHFHSDPRHHLIVAIEDGVVAGMISTVHYAHPDKPSPELWVNEVGVAQTHHGHGVGKAMMKEALEVGRRLGCQQAWVLTDRNNEAAMRLYAASGSQEGAPKDLFLTFMLDI